MKKTIVLKLTILAAVLLTAGMASAAHTYWTRPAASGPGNWNDAANWNGGVPDATSNNTYTGSSAGLAEIQVTDTQTYGEKNPAWQYHGRGPSDSHHERRKTFM